MCLGLGGELRWPRGAAERASGQRIELQGAVARALVAAERTMGAAERALGAAERASGSAERALGIAEKAPGQLRGPRGMKRMENKMKKMKKTEKIACGGTKSHHSQKLEQYKHVKVNVNSRQFF